MSQGRAGANLEGEEHASVKLTRLINCFHSETPVRDNDIKRIKSQVMRNLVTGWIKGERQCIGLGMQPGKQSLPGEETSKARLE